MTTDCGLVDATISASEKDLPVQNKIRSMHFHTPFRKVCEV